MKNWFNRLLLEIFKLFNFCLAKINSHNFAQIEIGASFNTRNDDDAWKSIENLKRWFKSRNLSYLHFIVGI